METTLIFKGLSCLCISMGKIMLEFGMKLIPWLQTLHKDTEYVRINVHSAQESVKRNVSYPGLKLPDADAVRWHFAVWKMKTYVRALLSKVLTWNPFHLTCAAFNFGEQYFRLCTGSSYTFCMFMHSIWKVQVQMFKKYLLEIFRCCKKKLLEKWM